ncbi:MAG: amidohydrolase [Lachnospiraceae bacterium]|nr:amidohydrolase [Lachnospiraceae bacterium]
MEDQKAFAIREIENKQDLICRVADDIWSHPELSLQEFHACELYCRVLREEGFRVEKGICGIETSFAASYGEGGPVIGILAEYDALSGLSQKAFAAEREPRDVGNTESDCGHGCGHNILGAGALAAAIGVRAFLKETGTPGTVILFGCPGEEGGAAKAFFARDGLWSKLDAALTWHPDDANEVVTGSNNACIQVQYSFHGIAAHASSEPDVGRSALDAVELMNIGVQFLREHMSDRARVHYAITDAGGRSPNVVQAESTVLYMVRSDKVAEAVALLSRVDKIAEGAALMTETRLTRKFIDGTAEIVPNHVLEQLLQRNFEKLGVPHYSPEEMSYADALIRTYTSGTKAPGLGSGVSADYAERAAAMRGGRSMNDFLLPLFDGAAFNPGSSDVGDVSWLTPTAQIHVAAWPNGCPGHSWQSTSSAGSSIGHKAALHAGRVLAAAALELFADPQLLEAARMEFQEKTSKGYTCPIPADAAPVVAD